MLLSLDLVGSLKNLTLELFYYSFDFRNSSKDKVHTKKFLLFISTYLAAFGDKVFYWKKIVRAQKCL